MQIHYLGTCSGTEPYAGTHHCSLMMETGGRIYWFDAGEGCAHTAHTHGIDIMKTRALFISHPHIDHTGGLPHLFFCIDKRIGREGRTLIDNNTLQMYLPDDNLLDALRLMGVYHGERNHFAVVPHTISRGIIHEDDLVRITAIPNTHLGQTEIPLSFSFLVEAEGQRIVYSGDVKRPEELDPFLQQGADLLIMETGHHRVADVCAYAVSRGVPRLRFNHHGREILNDRPAMQEFIDTVSRQTGISIRICEDGMTESLDKNASAVVY